MAKFNFYKCCKFLPLILFILILPSAYATLENLSFSYTTVSTWSSGQHVYLEINVSKIASTSRYNLTNISKTSASAAIGCAIFNKTANPNPSEAAASGSFVDNVCTISGGFMMDYGKSYRITNNLTILGDLRQATGLSFPLAKTLVTINASGYGDSGAWTEQNTQARSINAFEGFEVVDLGDITLPIVNATINNSIPRINYVINISANATDETGLSFCQFIDNQSLSNGQKTFFNISISGTSAQCSQNYTIRLSAGNVINFSVIVNDTNNNKAMNTTIITVAGTTPPVITITSTNFFKSDNTSIISRNMSNRVLLNLTLTDDIDLFGLEFNITNSSSNLFLNFTNTSLSGINFTFEKILNVSGAQGYYNVTIVAWDSHTATAIKDYKVNDGLGNTISFDDKIKITAENAIFAKATKKGDRYNMEFAYFPLFTPKIKTYYIESDGELIYINNSGFKAHFVDWKNKRWIDFEGINETPTITKINERKWQVTFNNAGTSITFNSIGGLNSRQNSFIYYLSDFEIKWFMPSPQTSDTFTSSYSVSLNITGDGKNYTTFYLYNSSDLISSSNVSGKSNGTYFFNTTFSSLTNSLYYINATHFDVNNEYKNAPTLTISKIQINNCTPAGYPSSNYTFKDEENNSIITIGTITGTYDYNVSATYSTTYTSIRNYTICVYPNSSSIPATYSITYSGNGYPQRTYSGTTTFNNVTQSVTLYALVTSNGIYGRFKVVDQYQNPISSATGIMKLSIGGVLTIVESETSDSAGLMTFFLNPDDTYTFTFSKTGYTSNTVSLRVTTSDVYTVTLSTPSSTISESVGAGITYSLSPVSQTLINSTAYDFIFNLSSSFWNITACTLYLENTTQIFTSNTNTFNGSLCNILINANTGRNSTIIARAVYQLNGTTNQSVTNQYSIKYSYRGTFSLKVALDDISNFGGAGFDNFGRALLALVFTFLIVGGISLEFQGMREPESLLLVAWGFTALFSYLNWYNLPLNAIPTLIVGGITLVSQAWLQQYIIFILMTLFVSGFLINKFTS